jgi:hypothetical protein
MARLRLQRRMAAAAPSSPEPMAYPPKWGPYALQLRDIVFNGPLPNRVVHRQPWAGGVVPTLTAFTFTPTSAPTPTNGQLHALQVQVVSTISWVEDPPRPPNAAIFGDVLQSALELSNSTGNPTPDLGSSPLYPGLWQYPRKDLSGPWPVLP